MQQIISTRYIRACISQGSCLDFTVAHVEKEANLL